MEFFGTKVEMVKPALTPQQERLTQGKDSALALYKQMAVGGGSWAQLVHYELCTLLFSGLPGLIGLGSRSVLFPALFKECGKRPAFGRGISLRQPGAIAIGQKLLADDYCVLDARGIGSQITIGDFVSIGRFTTIAAKEAKISIASGVNIGSYARIATQSRIEIGESTLIAAYCYIGPGNHAPADGDKPLIAQEMEIKGGVSIGQHCWIGAHSTVLDGVTIGDNSIVGAHSLVRESIPPNSIAVGCPARVIRSR